MCQALIKGHGVGGFWKEKPRGAHSSPGSGAARLPWARVSMSWESVCTCPTCLSFEWRPRPGAPWPFPQRSDPGSVSFALSGPTVYSAQEVEVSVVWRGSPSTPALGMLLSELVACLCLPSSCFPTIPAKFVPADTCLQCSLLGTLW